MKYSTAISVVMPCYNYGKYVQSAIESILSQSMPDFEFIIINDGSSDDSHDVITSFKDRRIKYIHLKKNTGNYAARNIGIEHATGKYIAVMDADDISIPERLSDQYNYLEKNAKIGCVGTSGLIIDENSKPLSMLTRVLKYQDLRLELMKDNCFLHPSLMIRKSLLDKYSLRYDESLIYSADYDLMWQCSRFFKICNLPQVLVNYRVHAKQISSEKRTEQREFANRVRIKQLDRFEAEITIEDQQLYLKLMNDEFLSIDELDDALILFNVIMKSNEKLRLYPALKLYRFLEDVLGSAVFKLQLS